MGLAKPADALAEGIKAAPLGIKIVLAIMVLGITFPVLKAAWKYSLTYRIRFLNKWNKWVLWQKEEEQEIRKQMAITTM